MNTEKQRKLAIKPEEVLLLVEDLGVDEDVARGMLAVRLGFTDHVVALPSNGADRRPIEHDRVKQADVE